MSSFICFWWSYYVNQSIPVSSWSESIDTGIFEIPVLDSYCSLKEVESWVNSMPSVSSNHRLEFDQKDRFDGCDCGYNQVKNSPQLDNPNLLINGLQMEKYELNTSKGLTFRTKNLTTDWKDTPRLVIPKAMIYWYDNYYTGLHQQTMGQVYKRSPKNSLINLNVRII